MDLARVPRDGVQPKPTAPRRAAPCGRLDAPAGPLAKGVVGLPVSCLRIPMGTRAADLACGKMWTGEGPLGGDHGTKGGGARSQPGGAACGACHFS